MTRPGRGRRTRGLTFVEVAVAIALLGVVFSLAGGGLLTLQRQTTAGLLQQEVAGRARHVVQLVASELRDASRAAADLDPPAPVECLDLGFRVAVDHTAGTTVLDPARVSGAFRRVRLVGRRLERVAADGQIRILAEQVDGLSLTLLAPDRLRIVVEVRRRGVGGGQVVSIQEVVLLLRNQG